MSLSFGIPIMLVAAALQSSWLESVKVIGGRPDLVLVLVVAWAIIRGGTEGALWGFAGGFILDGLSGGAFGLWTLSLTLVGFLTGQPWVHRLGPTLIRLASMSVVGTLVGHIVLMAGMAVVGLGVNIPRGIQAVAGPAALLNLLLSPFAFTFLVWFHKRSNSQQEGFS